MRPESNDAEKYAMVYKAGRQPPDPKDVPLPIRLPGYGCGGDWPWLPLPLLLPLPLPQRISAVNRI